MRTKIAVSMLVLPIYLVLAGPAQAVKIPKIPVVKAFKAKLHVAGGLTITTRHDDTGKCTPGQAWTMRESVDMEINDIVSVTDFRNTISSGFAKSRGGVRQVSRISGYRSTNNCPPTAKVKLLKPDCETFGGTGLANLIPDPRMNGKVSIGMTRKGAGAQDPSCFGMAVDNTTPKGSAITALQMSFTPISLPTNLKVKSFRTLKEGKSLISVIQIAGNCKSAVVDGRAHASAFPGASAFTASSSSIAGASGTAEDTCEVDGTFNVLVKRL